MKTLLSADAALSLHDLAHEKNDEGLHGMALKALAEARLPHIATSDESFTETVEEPEPVEDGAIKPFTFCPIGPIRETGAYKFPLVAQTMITGKRYQIHKAGHLLCVFNSVGKEVVDANFAAPLAQMGVPQVAVWEGILGGTTLWLYDVLYQDGQTYDLPLHERLQLLQQHRYRGNVDPLPHCIIRNPDELGDLGPGLWVVRWMNEQLHLSAPFWFRHEGQAIRPGQCFQPAKAAGRTEDMVDQEILVQRKYEGLRCQVSAWKGQVRIFSDGSPKDLSSRLRPAVSVLKQWMHEKQVESVVFDATLIGNDGSKVLDGEAIAAAVDARIPDAAFAVICSDLLYLNGIDLHNVPVSERYTKLTELVPRSAETISCADWHVVSSAECWNEVRDKFDDYAIICKRMDSTYPLLGASKNWWELDVVDIEPVEPADNSAETAEALAAQAKDWLAPE